MASLTAKMVKMKVTKSMLASFYILYKKKNFQIIHYTMNAHWDDTNAINHLVNASILSMARTSASAKTGIKVMVSYVKKATLKNVSGE